MTADDRPARFEITRRDVNLSLLTAAFAAAARLPAIAAPAVPLHLFDFAIAGAFYYEFARVRTGLRPASRLELLREPANPYDTNAVAVHTQEGDKLGFIPRTANAPIARLLDAGHTVRAEITEMLSLHRYQDLPDDLVFTSVASGDPVIRLTTFQNSNHGAGA